MLKSSNRWKFLAVLFPIIGTLCHAQPIPGGQSMFATAWTGYTVSDPYLLLTPTAYWHPSKTRDTTDLILGITATNTTTPATITANGWEFNGTTEHLDVGYPTAIEPGTNRLYSMTAWVRGSTSNNATRGIMGKLRTTANDQWGIVALAPGIQGQMGEGALKTATDLFPYQSNTWYHLTFTFNLSVASNLFLYVDGALYATASRVDADPINFNDGILNFPFRIGSFANASGAASGLWNGYIDRVAIWNGRVLTSNEVYNLFEQSRAGKK